MKHLLLIAMLLPVMCAGQADSTNLQNVLALGNVHFTSHMQADTFLATYTTGYDSINCDDVIYPSWIMFVMEDGSIKCVGANELHHTYIALYGKNWFFREHPYRIKHRWKVTGAPKDILDNAVAIYSYGDEHQEPHTVEMNITSQYGVKLSNKTFK